VSGSTRAAGNRRSLLERLSIPTYAEEETKHPDLDELLATSLPSGSAKMEHGQLGLVTHLVGGHKSPPAKLRCLSRH
jgi:hypothetical protein